MPPVPTDYPASSPHSWKKTFESDAAIIWRNGEGDIVGFYKTGDPDSDYWEFADGTNTASEGQATGPFDSYIDALGYVNTFIPELGIDDLPDVDYPDDAVVEIGSYPNKATDRECHECEQAIFTSYRVEYGDGSHEWLCPPCAAERFDWDLEKDPTATVDFDSDDHYEGMSLAREELEAHAEALLGARVTDVNTLSMVLQSLYQHRYNSQRDDPDEPPAALRLQTEILGMVREYREEHPDVSWADIRDALDEARRFAHEYAREEFGKSQGQRELIEEIQESGMTPNEWFEANVE